MRVPLLTPLAILSILIGAAALASAAPTRGRPLATFAPAPSLGASVPTASPTVDVDAVEARVRTLESRVNDSLATITRVSDLTIKTAEATVKSAETYATYLTYGIGILAAVAALLGFREVTDFRKRAEAIRAEAYEIAERVRREADEALTIARRAAEEAQAKIIAVEGDLTETIALSRAIPILMRAEIQVVGKEPDDPVRKQILAIQGEEALHRLREATGVRPATPRVMNWIAYASKRCGRLDDALNAAEVAYRDAPERTYEHVRAAYNIACYLSLSGDASRSRDFLAKAVAMDSRYKIIAQSDPDLRALKQDPTTKTDVEKLLAD